MNRQIREVEEVLLAQATSDGDGVRLKRVFGGQNLDRFDPFLMLDEFGSDQAVDYIGGFPPHPHRGFTTVTYMLDGYMEHRDHMGNVGKLGPGDVQWMKAGSGVIHSEMPQQEEGRMHGFQLWVNLPASEKMTPAEYKDISSEDIPAYRVGQVDIKSVAGNLKVNEVEAAGHVTGLSTEPGYLDLHYRQAGELEIDVPDGHTALLYVYEGGLDIGTSGYELNSGRMARLSDSGIVRIQGRAGARALLISGKPINEPIVHKGPFVMNTAEEIQQAIRDYSEGVLV